MLASAKYRVQIPRNWLKYTTGICIRIGVLWRSAKVSARYASSISTSMIQLHPCKWKRNRNRIRSKTVSGTDAPGAKEIAGSRQKPDFSRKQPGKNQPRSSCNSVWRESKERDSMILSGDSATFRGMTHFSAAGKLSDFS